MYSSSDEEDPPPRTEGDRSRLTVEERRRLQQLARAYTRLGGRLVPADEIGPMAEDDFARLETVVRSFDEAYPARRYAIERLATGFVTEVVWWVLARLE